MEIDHNRPFDLPQELLHHILLLGALSSNGLAAKLCQLSRWVYQMIYPHIYRVVTLDDMEQSKRLIKALRAPFVEHGIPNTTPIPYWPKSNLESLWVTHNSNHTFRIYRHCAGERLSRLSLSVTNLHWLFHASTVESNGEGELRHSMLKDSQDLDVLIQDNANHNWVFTDLIVAPQRMSPLWKKVTKIWLANYDDWRQLPEIQHFQRLTHLAIPFRVTSNPDGTRHNPLTQLQSLLAHPTLSHLVLVVYPDTMSESDYSKTISTIRHGLRIHPTLYAIQFKHTQLQNIWEHSARGMDDRKWLWDEAEDFTERVRRLGHDIDTWEAFEL